MEWWHTLIAIFGFLLALFATGLPIFVCFMILNVSCVLFLMGTGGLGLFVNSMLETTTAEALVAVPLYLLLGWVAAWFIGPIMDGAGVAAVVLLIVGGALYSIGGVLYGLKWPNPWPTTFGHHEFFHACTAVAAICHYIAMWFAVF